jgi:hypothetical protein
MARETLADGVIGRKRGGLYGAAGVVARLI